MYDGWRLDSDQDEMATYAPYAYWVTDSSGHPMLVEQITCELGNDYLLGYTWDEDSGDYFAYVLEPDDLDYGGDVHATHLFADNKICLNDQSSSFGMESMPEARARAVLWCSGYSGWQETGEFLFSR